MEVLAPVFVLLLAAFIAFIFYFVLPSLKNEKDEPLFKFDFSLIEKRKEEFTNLLDTKRDEAYDSVGRALIRNYDQIKQLNKLAEHNREYGTKYKGKREDILIQLRERKNERLRKLAKIPKRY